MNRVEEIAETLVRDRERTIRFYGDLAESSLDLRLRDGGWTVKQVLAHLSVIERSMHWLFRNVLAGGAGSPRDFDVDRFNREQTAKVEHESRDALIDRFRTARDDTIAIVRAMSDADLDRRAWHAFHGDGTLERSVRWAYEHTDHHERQVRERLAR